RGPELQGLDLDKHQCRLIDLPGRPRWGVTDAKGKRVFLAIGESSMVLTAELLGLGTVQHWKLPSAVARGIDVARETKLLSVDRDGGGLVQMDSLTGRVLNEWPLAGIPDATFFNAANGLVHVAIGDPGLVQTVDPRSGASTKFTTGRGAKTTALVAPDHLYVFSPSHGGALVLANA